MFCEQCGNQLEDNASFCGKCGNQTSQMIKMTPHNQPSFNNNPSFGERKAIINPSGYLIGGFAVIAVAVIFLFVSSFAFYVSPWNVIFGQYLFLDFIDEGFGWWRILYIILAIIFIAALLIGIKGFISEATKPDYSRKALAICSITNSIAGYMAFFYGAAIIMYLILSKWQFSIVNTTAWIPLAVGIGAKMYFSIQVSNIKKEIKRLELSEQCENGAFNMLSRGKTISNNNALWECPRCGAMNANYCGTCGCGTRRP